MLYMRCLLLVCCLLYPQSATQSDHVCLRSYDVYSQVAFTHQNTTHPTSIVLSSSRKPAPEALSSPSFPVAATTMCDLLPRLAVHPPNASRKPAIRAPSTEHPTRCCSGKAPTAPFSEKTTAAAAARPDGAQLAETSSLHAPTGNGALVKKPSAQLAAIASAKAQVGTRFNRMFRCFVAGVGCWAVFRVCGQVGVPLQLCAFLITMFYSGDGGKF